jgi:hypothetical protein
MKYLASFFLTLGVLSLSLNSYAIDKNEKVIGTPVMFETMNHLWFFIHDRSQYDNLTKNIPYGNKMTENKVFLFELYGVDDIKIRDVKDKEKSKEFNFMVELNKNIKDKRSVISCFDFNENKNIPVCNVTVGSIDLAGHIIKNGISRFKSFNRSNKELDSEYKKLMDMAKNNKIGIWEPFYGIFH